MRVTRSRASRSSHERSSKMSERRKSESKSEKKMQPTGSRRKLRARRRKQVEFNVNHNCSSSSNDVSFSGQNENISIDTVTTNYKKQLKRELLQSFSSPVTRVNKNYSTSETKTVLRTPEKANKINTTDHQEINRTFSPVTPRFTNKQLLANNKTPLLRSSTYNIIKSTRKDTATRPINENIVDTIVVKKSTPFSVTKLKNDLNSPAPTDSSRLKNNGGMQSKLPKILKLINENVQSPTGKSSSKTLEKRSLIKTRQAESSVKKTPKVLTRNVSNYDSPSGAELTKTTSARKMPDFASIHKKQFQKMENLYEYASRKADRAKQLFSTTGTLPTSTKKLKNAEVELQVEKVRPPIRPSGVTRFGFNTKAMKSRCDKLKEEIMKKQIVPRDVARKRERVYVKGVRSNRRFDLLMQSRENN